MAQILGIEKCSEHFGAFTVIHSLTLACKRIFLIFYISIIKFEYINIHYT